MKSCLVRAEWNTEARNSCYIIMLQTAVIVDYEGRTPGLT